MLISDWSSDVCSSDLKHGLSRCWTHRDFFWTNVNQMIKTNKQSLLLLLLLFSHGVPAQTRNNLSITACHELAKAERKSVVSGKRVSVRVEHGGRGLIKKKIEMKNQEDRVYITE